MNSLTLLHPTRASRLIATLWLCALALLSGCAGVKVSSIQASDYLAQKRSDILTAGELSAATQESLRVIGIELKSCENKPPECR